MLKINVKVGDFRQEETDAIALGIYEGEDSLTPLAESVDQALGGAISNLMGLGDFEGKLKQVVTLYTNGKVSSPRISLVGCGKAEDFNQENIRQVSAKHARSLRNLGVKKIIVPIPDDISDLSVQAIVEGVKLGLYTFDQHKTEGRNEIKELEELTFLTANESRTSVIKQGIELGNTITDGVILARDLTNQPANYLTPTILAETAQSVAKEKNLRCEIFDSVKLQEEKFGAMLGVSQGSLEEPRFVILEYGFEEANEKDTLVLVGKGITFDSGGLSLKSGSGMETMKDDMAGAATVLGAMQAIGELKPDLHVVGLIAASENMPSGTAQRPGDIVTSYGGKTIEILNTDAEGRLVLADALGYAKNFKPEAVIDFATLTGAVVTSLGRSTAGIMGTDQKLVDRIISAAEKTHERVWQLPLWDDYEEALKSEVADVKNTGDGTAGAIAGGTFLKKFAEGYSWTHIDIGGTAFDIKGSSYISKGGSGYGVRLLIQLVRDWH
ncbi:TPA: leucyl aminopeptidase [Candidatus Poribacteria bacterium]|nr:leucyl aminopeptidase [Candidatus Poribacteria bacterium]